MFYISRQKDGTVKCQIAGGSRRETRSYINVRRADQ